MTDAIDVEFEASVLWRTSSGSLYDGMAATFLARMDGFDADRAKPERVAGGLLVSVSESENVIMISKTSSADAYDASMRLFTLSCPACHFSGPSRIGLLDASVRNLVQSHLGHITIFWLSEDWIIQDFGTISRRSRSSTIANVPIVRNIRAIVSN